MSDTADEKLFQAITDLRKEIREDFREMREDLTGRLNNHSDRIRSLESSRSWAMGAGAVIGAITGWVASKLGK